MKMKTIALLIAGTLAANAFAAPIPKVKYADEINDGRPAVRWRGFNLLEMFYRHGPDSKPAEFDEDFQLIHEFGFNFVRLPMDYRFWIKDGKRENWTEFDEENLKCIDHAIELGEKYDIHVNLNMHRCPGWTVARPFEPTSLFTDPETLRVCALHWAMFAKRYRGVSNERLSFNLFNEPPHEPTISAEQFAKVVKALVDAIHREDPKRFVITDGLATATEPVPALYSVQNLGQSVHCYKPHGVSHYLATWAGNPSLRPFWPYSPDMPDGVIGNAINPDPLVIEDLPACDLDMAFDEVSHFVVLRFTADGEVLRESRIAVDPSGKNPLWPNPKYMEMWKVYQGRYLGHEKLTLKRPVKRLVIERVDGDWIRPAFIEFTDGKNRCELNFNFGFRQKSFNQRFLDWQHGFARSNRTAPRYQEPGLEYLYRAIFEHWDRAIESGVFCHVGETGVWNKTPHAVTLALMEDYLKLWKERNIGWALWQFRGGFGILDTEREGVDFEDYKGHKLDRKLLELLQKY